MDAQPRPKQRGNIDVTLLRSTVVLPTSLQQVLQRGLRVLQPVDKVYGINIESKSQIISSYDELC